MHLYGNQYIVLPTCAYQYYYRLSQAILSILCLDFHKHPHLLQRGWMKYLALGLKSDLHIAVIEDMEMRIVVTLRILPWSAHLQIVS